MIDGINGLIRVVVVFFFKQKTAYELRISDWSSDVCSSDLIAVPTAPSTIWRHSSALIARDGSGFLIDPPRKNSSDAGRKRKALELVADGKIGRASCRERVCQYV